MVYIARDGSWHIAKDGESAVFIEALCALPQLAHRVYGLFGLSSAMSGSSMKVLSVARSGR